MPKHHTLTISHINNIDLGKEAEDKGKLDEAAKYYESAIRDERPDEVPFNRLMVIYRKQKKLKDELRVINKGIRMFEDFYRQGTAKKSKGKKLRDLSEAFMKGTGLTDKKGKSIYQPEPIGKWMKRKKMVEVKLNG